MKRLPKSLSLEAFRAAWKESRDSKSGTAAGAPGVDRVRANAFGSDLDNQIANIRIALQQGNYRFNRLRFAPIQKPSGDYRIIAIPTVRDRLLQRTLLRHLEADRRFNPNSQIAYGFIKGRKLADAQRRARELREANPWVLQADIVKFFDRINRSDLEKLIHKRVRGKTITTLLSAAIRCEIEDVGGKGAELIRESGIIAGKGLRQGMPISPMLSNLLLKRFDTALIKAGLIAIRYADDIIIFGKSQDELLTALSLVIAALKQEGLHVPALEENGKTQIRPPQEPVEFLGVEIRRKKHGYELVAPIKKISEIEKRMAKMASLEECVKEKRDISQILRSLDSLIIGYRGSMSVLDDPSQFFNRLEAAKRRQVNNLLIRILGEKTFKNLPEAHRAVLGLQPFPET